jgi:WXXGXW repeat (2 copies)
MNRSYTFIRRSTSLATSLGLTLVLATAAGAGCYVQGTAGMRTTTPGYVAYQAPPEPQQEQYTPMQGQVWIKGRWEMQNSQWVWQPGRWQAQRNGYDWRDGNWEQRGNSWHYVDGQWVVAQQVGNQGSNNVVSVDGSNQQGGVTVVSRPDRNGGGYNNGGRPPNNGSTVVVMPDGSVGVAGNGVIVNANGAPGAWPTSAPPAPRSENSGPPQAGFVWVAGNYKWAAGQYSWMPGHWERARANQNWNPGRWEPRNNQWFWIEGSWGVAGSINVNSGNGPQVRDHR